jgi:hypothetical protein
MTIAISGIKRNSTLPTADLSLLVSLQQETNNSLQQLVDIQRERLEVERERLGIERRRLQMEEQKMQNSFEQ